MNGLLSHVSLLVVVNPIDQQDAHVTRTITKGSWQIIFIPVTYIDRPRQVH